MTDYTNHVTYKDYFASSPDVEFYENSVYATNSYSHFMWTLQRPILRQIIINHCLANNSTDNIKLLDFACGTGRITSAIEDLVSELHGFDISEEMVKIARQKSKKSEFFVGDIHHNNDPNIADYDIITSYRLLLNVEPELRVSLLRQLRKRVKSKNSLLITNIHGNSNSVRHLPIAVKRLRRFLSTRAVPGEILNEMSLSEANIMFRESGFAIESIYGFGIMPPTLYRTPLVSLAKAVDMKISGKCSLEGYITRLMIDLMFVCRPI